MTVFHLVKWSFRILFIIACGNEISPCFYLIQTNWHHYWISTKSLLVNVLRYFIQVLLRVNSCLEWLLRINVLRLTVLANYSVLNWLSINIHLMCNSIDWNNYRRAWKSEIGQYREEWGWDARSFLSLHVKWSHCSCNNLLAQVSGLQNNHPNMHIWVCHCHLVSFLPSAGH